MKNYTLYKHLYCLLPLFLLTGIIATCNLNAKIIESFPPDSFWEVDHTTPKYTYGGGRQYNPTGIIGYKFVLDSSSVERKEYYQLTDTIQSMAVALWHKQKLDLNQNWQFDCELFFDTGSALVNTNIQVGRADRMIADGFCFVLNNKDTLENLIGGKQMDIGYGGISPSFAIEFDTEDNGYWREGAEGQLLSSGSHISYLRDGAMQVIPGSLSQMQNGWGTVASSQWYKVRIVWRKVYENNTTYYELSTYMEEKNNINGPLLLRSSMRFNSLSEVIAGL